MGKGTDKLYITHSEWSSSDAYTASVGANASSRPAKNGAKFRRLPFNFCAASLQPFKNPVCTPDGTIFDVEVIGAWLEKHPNQNPVNGEPLQARDLIKLKFARNSGSDSRGAGLSDDKGDLVDPVTYKVFTDNTHIVALRHGHYANVFAWDTVERMNIKAKMWNDLLDDEPFERADIITLQDPHDMASRNLEQFKYLRDGEAAQATKEQEDELNPGNINSGALGSLGEKVLKARVAVEKARRSRAEGGDVNRSSGLLSKTAEQSQVNNAVPREPMLREKRLDPKSAAYTTGRTAASFTSTGLTPETSGERALLTDEEYMLKPRRVKTKGYARLETNLGDLTLELHTDTAPKAVWNFVRLAQKGYYKGVPFHRNIPNFMIQGGDPSGTGKGGTSIWGKSFDDEFDGPLTHNARGTVSMANKGKNTNSSQFFITYKATPHLDRKHTIFATVVSGQPVLKKMEDVPTDGSNRPLNKIVLTNVVVFVDPFEEFQSQKQQQERDEAARAAKNADSDTTTWTGKRIRTDGSIAALDGAITVGKYLKTSAGQGAGSDNIEAVESMPEQPTRKKMRGSGGFGNFDGW